MPIPAIGYVRSEVLSSALAADYRPDRPFRARIAGTVSPLVVEEADGGEVIYPAGLTDTMIDRGLDEPILLNAIKRQSADGNTTTGSTTEISATNRIIAGTPSWAA